MHLFISDLHLHESRPKTSQLFFDFVAGPARSADRLTILGDLFEYWAGDEDVATDLHARICAALQTLTANGITVRFLPGNRDFLIGTGFLGATGATLLPEPSIEKIGGIDTLLLHGDTLCTDDEAYQQYRRTVRDQAFIDDFLKKPLRERKQIIQGMRERSETEKSHKSLDIMDVADASVRAAFRDAGVTRMIHGHTHRLAVHRYDIDGTSCERWVLGDWGSTGNFLECGNGGWQLNAWDGRHGTPIHQFPSHGR